MPHHSYENDFDLHENETASRTHNFHMKSLHLGLFGNRGTRELRNGHADLRDKECVKLDKLITTELNIFPHHVNFLMSSVS